MGVDPQHFEVYRQPGRYAGWPANYGIWSWGDEIVVGFTAGYMDLEGEFHKRDKARPFTAMQARSTDGGRTWEAAPTPCRTPGGRALSADEHQAPELHVAAVLEGDEAPQPLSAAVDFTHPDFALMCGRSGLVAGAVSWFYLSTDRCRTWDGPFELPQFGFPGIAARTDCLVSGPAEATLLLTAAKPNLLQGRVFCARTVDGGRSFSFVSWVGPEPRGSTIMPSTLRLADGRLLSAVRRREEEGCWIQFFHSQDGGASWEQLDVPVIRTGHNGNPAAMIQLQDGRLCVTYGFRDAPYGMRARLSADEGYTWGDEMVLRDGGGDGDIGYPRTVQRADGRVVTVYYFNDEADGERYIAATVWDPG